MMFHLPAVVTDPPLGDSVGAVRWAWNAVMPSRAAIGLAWDGGQVACSASPMTGTRMETAITWRRLCGMLRLPAVRIKLCVVVSLLLMLVGHWQTVGQVFDPLTGETYNVFTRWVSDFAAKQPEGWWIKGAIATFCLALVDFFGPLARREARDMRGVWRGFGVLVMSALMVGGLLLVAVFDISPKQYEIIESRVILDQARAEGGGEPSEEAGEIPWWEVLLEPKGSTLREGMLRDAPLPDEEMRPLRQRIADEGWDERQVLEYLRERLHHEAAPHDATAADTPAVEVRSELRPVRREPKELSKHWYHRLGFQLFLFGFGCGSVWLAAREWRGRAFARLPGTFLMLLLTVVFGIWLMAEKLGLAGVPQRALLLLICLWLLRNLCHACPRQG